MKYKKMFTYYTHNTMRQLWKACAVAAMSVSLLSPQSAPAEDQSRSKSSGPTVPLKDARLKIEANATDSDAGIQVFIDADPWKVMRIFDPSGKMIFESKPTGRLGLQGGTELFLESAEPEFSKLPFESIGHHRSQ